MTSPIRVRHVDGDPAVPDLTGEFLAREAGEMTVEDGATSNRAEPGDSVEHSFTGGRTQSDDSVEEAGSAQITVDGLPTGDGVYAEDDGPGIPESDRETVFDAGYSTATGSGFGLAIVREITEAHR